MDHQFRNAVFGGFNRQDVLDYLETLARENAQKRQELEQSIGRAEGERDELRAQKQALEEQKRALEGEKEELLRSVQRSQSELAALRTQLGEREQTARQTQQALEESRREAEALREQVARLEPDAAAYAAVKDRSAGVELEAHRRAQGVLDQANSQARHLRQQMEQWMTRVGREYDAPRWRPLSPTPPISWTRRESAWSRCPPCSPTRTWLWRSSPVPMTAPPRTRCPPRFRWKRSPELSVV